MIVSRHSRLRCAAAAAAAAAAAKRGTRRGQQRRVFSSSSTELVDALRRSLVADVAPLNLKRWTPSVAELRRELTFKPRGTMATPSKGEDPFALVRPEVAELVKGMRSLVSTDHPLLSAAATHFFDNRAAGKQFRGGLVLLASKAFCGQDQDDVILPSQARLAEIVELIHLASLFHDDVVDASRTRRGVSSVNGKFGDKVAVLGGDFLLARACVALARLRDNDVVELMATIIEHLVRGELLQMRDLATDDDDPFEKYLTKNFYKTGSLIANGCRAAVMLGSRATARRGGGGGSARDGDRDDHNDDDDRSDAAFEYGRHVGLAFQLVDDVLDFSADDATIGKPALNDLRQGLATAPTLLAAREFPELEPLIQRKFRTPGDVDVALEIVLNSNGIQATKDLALVQAELAVDKLRLAIPEPTEPRLALERLAAKVVYRNH